MIKFRAIAASIAATATIQICCHAQPIDNYIGYYSSESQFCTEYSKQEDKFVSCKTKFKDCLLIKDSTDGGINIQIYNIQADENVCAINTRGEFTGGNLISRFPQSDRYIKFTPEKGQILLELNGPLEGGNEYCGAHARWVNLTLKKITDKPGNLNCFSE